MERLSQVLDYFNEPVQAVRQFHNLLKPGGMVIASLPSFAPAFDEAEKWRFTKSGVKLLFAPFASVEIVPEVSSFGGVLRSLNLAIETFVMFDALRLLHRLTTCPLINLPGMLEGLNLSRNDQFSPNYSVRAVKAR
jgi:hypothetical protein